MTGGVGPTKVRLLRLSARRWFARRAWRDADATLGAVTKPDPSLEDTEVSAQYLFVFCCMSSHFPMVLGRIAVGSLIDLGSPEPGKVRHE